MSVIKQKRKESSMEFIYNARQLQIFTIRKCVNFPKRYTFYLGQQLANQATNIHRYVKMANSIYPTNQHEVQLRRDYLLKANSELNSLVSQIEVATEMLNLNSKILHEWTDLIEKEIRLVKGVLKTDHEKYKNLL